MQSDFIVIKYIIMEVWYVCVFIGNFVAKVRFYKQTCKIFNVKLKKMPEDIEHRWNSTYLVLLAFTFYKHFSNTFIFDFNGLHPNNQLDKMEEYELEIAISLQNILPSFLCFHSLFIWLLLSHYYSCFFTNSWNLIKYY